MKKILKEAGTKSSTLFGGQNNRVVVPPDGTHASQSGWQSGNGYDIFNQPGTPVYAISSGKVYKLDDYGGFRQENGKKLYGVKLTVDSSDNLPDVYYAHLERPAVQNGQTVTCGQLLGYIKLCPPQVGKPESSHVHIAVERGSITAFLNKDGSIKCSNTQGTTPSTQGTTPSTQGTTPNTQGDSSETDTYKKDPFYIPRGEGPLASTLSGVANRALKSVNITNSITAKPTIKESYGSTNYLRFCNISNLLITNGQKVEKNTKLGQTTNEVEVSKYDSYKDNLKLDKSSLIGKNLKVKSSEKIIIPGAYNDYIKSPVSGIVYTGGTSLGCPNKIEIEFYDNNRKKEEDSVGLTRSRSKSGLSPDPGKNPDPILNAITMMPYNLFKDKKDKKTGEIKKGFGWPGQNVAPLDYFDPEYYKKESVDKNIDRIIEIMNYKKNIL